MILQVIDSLEETFITVFPHVKEARAGQKMLSTKMNERFLKISDRCRPLVP